MKATILPPDKTHNYHIPGLQRAYVRTGVIGDGSCFFHSYLRATNYRYKMMPTSARQQSVKQLRESLSASVDLNSIMRISNGEYRKMLFFGALRQLIRNTRSLLSVDTLINILEIATNYKTNFYETFIEEALKRAELDKASTAEKQQFIDAMKKLFVEANELSINHLKEQLLVADISTTEIEFIARHLKCNFIFLYETDKGIQTYPFSTIIDVDWPFCVLLWVQESHYEIIGVKEGHVDKLINRVFYKDDEIIKVYGAQNDLSENPLEK